jgi:predicted nucleic acid-binding protein
MSAVFTVDASVFVSAFTPSEPAHPSSKTFLRQVRQEGAALVLPTLVIVEIAAAIGRGQGKPELGYAFAMEISRFPELTLVPLDDDLAKEAAEIAAAHRLRASDAVYVAVARRSDAALVTLDSEQAERAKDVIHVRLLSLDSP